MADIISINKLLSKKLKIPDYQRPYKWTERNIGELLADIKQATEEAERYGSEFKYRIGTIILHREGKGKEVSYNIVDGQQRTISLILLKLYLKNDFSCTILKSRFANKISQSNIHNNYDFIKRWFSLQDDNVSRMVLDAFENVLEVVVIQVNKIQEAFQLFDSQNTRGKALDPHDLLKAYHLREMKGDKYEMKHAVTKWEAKDTSVIRELFGSFLFPIWNWSHRSKSRAFTVKEIDIYKGIPADKLHYPYARRASRTAPYFQITEPFMAGKDFFEFVEHYIDLREDIETEIKTNDEFAEIKKQLFDIKRHSVGFGYAKNLFYCALLMYYDKFHNFDVMAVKNLFTWSFMIRVDMEALGFDTINKYAIGEGNDRYTNMIPVFSKIDLARVHEEISGLKIKVQRYPDNAANEENWGDLYRAIKEINGLAGRENE